MLILLLLFFVSYEKTFGQLIQIFAVIQFHFGSATEEILQLADDRNLRLHPIVETSQLFVQLSAYICIEQMRGRKKCRYLFKIHLQLAMTRLQPLLHGKHEMALSNSIQ